MENQPSPPEPNYQLPQPVYPEPQQHMPPPNVPAGQPPVHSAPVKYGVFQALGDGVQAMLANFVPLIISAVVSIFFSAIVLGIGIAILAFVVVAGKDSSTGSTLVWAILGGLLLYMIWYVVAYAFVMSTTSLAIADGANHQASDIGKLFSRAFKVLPRVILTNLILASVIILPLLVISVGGIFLILAQASYKSEGAGILLILLTIGAIVWALVTSLSFCLAPYIALFEPNVPATKTLKRSLELLRFDGYWFLVKGYLLLVVVFIILSAATGSSSLAEVQGSESIASSLGIIFLSLIVNAVLVVLYLNRKAVRG